ncbi:MAG: hypothetical protein MJ229_08410 [bacterium]|nr:hypothetical protein [bacterium]
MILECRMCEKQLQENWLKGLYNLIEELDCKCKTHIEESYSQVGRNFSRNRVIEVSGSDTMLNCLKTRMERFLRFKSPNITISANLLKTE